MKTIKKNKLKINLFIFTIATTFMAISLFAPMMIYSALVLALLYDYFVLLGGNIYWLNRIIDDKDFHGTGIYRRMLAVDAKMIIIAVMSGLWILFLTEGHVKYTIEYPFHHISVWEYIKLMSTNDISFNNNMPLFFYTFFIKMFLLGQLTHSIHHIIINERLTGMRFSGYAPVTMFIKKIIKWARK